MSGSPTSCGSRTSKSGISLRRLTDRNGMTLYIYIYVIARSEYYMIGLIEKKLNIGIIKIWKEIKFEKN